MTNAKFFEYESHWSRTASLTSTLYFICSNPQKFKGKYGYKTTTNVCNQLDFFSIYREANKVNQLIRKKQLPVLLYNRPKKSVHIINWHKDYVEEIKQNLAKDKILNAMLEVEPYKIIYRPGSVRMS
jgi:hypothetical protein